MNQKPCGITTASNIGDWTIVETDGTITVDTAIWRYIQPETDKPPEINKAKEPTPYERWLAWDPKKKQDEILTNLTQDPEQFRGHIKGCPQSYRQDYKWCGCKEMNRKWSPLGKITPSSKTPGQSLIETITLPDIYTAGS